MNKKFIVCLFLCGIMTLTACGNVESDNSDADRVTDTSSSSADSILDTTTSTKAATTTADSSDDSSSRVTTTTIVSGTDRNGNVTTLIIGEGGKILSTSQNNKTTSKTTAKTTAKTTTKAAVNNVQNNGDGNNNYSYNNEQNSNQENNNNYSPAPVQTQAPQTERKTATQAPTPVTTTTTTAQSQSVSIDTADLDDTLKAYLRFGRGDKVSSYDWELIRQDVCNYAIENFNGKKDFIYAEDGYHYSFTVPLNLSVNTSWTDYSHAHYDGGSDLNVNNVYYFPIINATSDNELNDLAIQIQERVRKTFDQGLYNYWWCCYDHGDFDNPKIAPLCSELAFNIGIEDTGWVWFLTE